MKLRIALAAAALGLVAASQASAAGPATANTTATATIVAPSQLTATRSLDFGTIAKPTTGTTTVTVASAASPAATPAVSGGNGYIPTAGLAHASAFHLLGTSAETYSVTSTTLVFTGATGNLSAIGAEAPVAASGVLNTLPASGTDDVYIGGHFDITASTVAATYNGTLTLTINFD
ncbi:DUF4402 domain-containing protein [Phenylobacterium sp.]|uniref:DUF4402 domain-containing protein n=1 Tax=Phenylobacterium sp. TaxID=1871053 RepID=UPI0025ED7612|nr:DUF4402 domain-containing protein [Phenylobacterium sp.]